MELPKPELEPPRPRCRAPAAVWGALLACALLACALLGTLAALLLAGRRSSPPAQIGARLVLDGPGRIMKPGKLEWHADDRMDGVCLGPGFEYSAASHTLKIKNHGLYFVYAQLNVVHFFKSSSEQKGNATLTIHRQTAHGSDPILTLPLHLASRANRSLSAFAAVSPCQLAEDDLLYVTLTVSESNTAAESTRWYFGDSTVFGLYPISGSCNSGATGIGGCSPGTQELESISKDLGKFFQSNA